MTEQRGEHRAGPKVWCCEQVGPFPVEAARPVRPPTLSLLLTHDVNLVVERFRDRLVLVGLEALYDHLRCSSCRVSGPRLQLPKGAEPAGFTCLFDKHGVDGRSALSSHPGSLLPTSLPERHSWILTARGLGCSQRSIRVVKTLPKCRNGCRSAVSGALLNSARLQRSTVAASCQAIRTAPGRHAGALIHVITSP